MREWGGLSVFLGVFSVFVSLVILVFSHWFGRCAYVGDEMGKKRVIRIYDSIRLLLNWKILKTSGDYACFFIFFVLKGVNKPQLPSN